MPASPVTVSSPALVPGTGFDVSAGTGVASFGTTTVLAASAGMVEATPLPLPGTGTLLVLASVEAGGASVGTVTVLAAPAAQASDAPRMAPAPAWVVADAVHRPKFLFFCNLFNAV